MNRDNRPPPPSAGTYPVRIHWRPPWVIPCPGCGAVVRRFHHYAPTHCPDCRKGTP